MMMNFNAIISQSGGLSYHLQSIKRKKQWNPFKNQINSWLMNWPVSESQLVLIAPSAGYSLSYEFLKQFSNVVIIDPDPLAIFLFKKRFSAVSIKSSHKNYFFNPQGQWETEALKNIQKEYPNSQYLICNFLGQIPFLKKRSQVELKQIYTQLKLQVSKLFINSKWASYHDIFSSKSLKALESLQGNDSAGHALSQKVEVQDHYTSNIFNDQSGLNKSYFVWHIRKNYYHLIEAVK